MEITFRANHLLILVILLLVWNLDNSVTEGVIVMMAPMNQIVMHQ
jgi:hypothetical protein